MNNSTAIHRLIFTLIFSVIIHLMIVLGVNFESISTPKETVTNLEITLVKQQTELAPDEADYLAQANNLGGGNTDQKSPEPTPTLKPTETVIDTPVPVETPPAPVVPTPIEPVPPKPIVEPTTAKAVDEPTVEPEQPKIEEPTTPSKLITQLDNDRKVETAEIEAEQTKQQDKPKPRISARDLMLQTHNNISRLESELAASQEALSKAVDRRYVSARTTEYEAASYMKTWERKVERIGNMNYPQEAKRRGLNGTLILLVDILPDGTVPADGIVIQKSSGHELLDDAAVRIVRLGAPYSAIPDNVLKDHDRLTIIRTWKFETSRGLSTH